MDHASNQCLDQGLLQPHFSINMYILVLTPLQLPPQPSFFSLYSRTVGFFFSFPPAPPEAIFCWGAERAYAAFSNEEGRFAFSSPLFPLCPVACMPALFSSPSTVSVFSSIFLLFLSSSLSLLPFSILCFVLAICIQLAPLTTHPSIYLFITCQNFFHTSSHLFLLSQKARTSWWNVQSIQPIDATRRYKRRQGR